MSSSPPPAVEVDIENGSSSPPPVIPAPSFWSRFTEAVDAVEERIANFLGLNESKYQWAMDEYMKQQLVCIVLYL
ncbi:hypothetical protein R1sor_021717 [Riccia sorocarpa]|uniref:Uncharacterized protein n=1 Tax=Riccia sorocarpa TaxID=122646 RepID=A0ABD3GLK8_9MARC